MPQPGPAQPSAASGRVPTGVAAAGRPGSPTLCREGRKLLKRSNTKPSGQAALSTGKAVSRPGGGWPALLDAARLGPRSAHLSCLVWLTMDRTFSSPSIFGLPNSSSFTCWERHGKAVSPDAREGPPVPAPTRGERAGLQEPKGDVSHRKQGRNPSEMKPVGPGWCLGRRASTQQEELAWRLLSPQPAEGCLQLCRNEERVTKSESR